MVVLKLEHSMCGALESVLLATLFPNGHILAIVGD